MSNHSIDSVGMFIERVIEELERWGKGDAWYRGQSIDKPLIPRLFRKRHNELQLLQRFRLRAQTFGKTPDIKRIDEWLFLMQHTGLPTRLLDWTEGALIALFFAVYDLPAEPPSPVVWMLDAPVMNNIATDSQEIPLSWTANYGLKNFQAAFQKNREMAYELPVAIYPVNIHLRASVQRSCFTIHGKKEEGIEKLFADTKLVEDGRLVKYEIDATKAKRILWELYVSGISYSTLFPDFDGLARELKEFY